jgi:hypothetical protein
MSGKRIMKFTGQIGSGIEPGILRIPGLLVLKNLFSSIISGLRACLCPSENRFPSRFPVWTGFIR